MNLLQALADRMGIGKVYWFDNEGLRTNMLMKNGEGYEKVQQGPFIQGR